MITSITQSLLNQFAKCPHQVYLSRVKGILIPPGIAARKGSSVHKGAEYLHHVKAESGQNAPMDEATDAARDEYQRLVIEEGVFLTPEEKADKNQLLNTALNEAVSSVRTYRKHIIPAMRSVALVEERLYADVGADIPVSGKPDVVADGIINDIKTTGKRWNAGLEHTQMQPTIYRMLLKSNGYDPLPARYVILTALKTKPKDGTIYDPEESVCCDCRNTERTDEQELKLVARIKAVYQQIKAGNFPPGPSDQWWCLSMDTEVLTKRGWRNYEAILDDDEIVTLNTASMNLEYQPLILKFIKKHPSRKMVAYDGRGIKFCVTPDHRMIIRSLSRGVWRWTTAGEIENKGSIVYPVSSYLHREGINFTDNMLSLSGWLCAEGHFRTKQDMIELTQKYGTKGYQKIYTLLSLMQIPFSYCQPRNEQIGMFRIRTEASRELRKTLQPNKNMPEWANSMNAHQFRIWLESFVDGDGNRSAHSITVSSKDKEFLDSLQTIAVTQRFSAIMSQEYTSSTGGKYHSLSMMDGYTERIPEPAIIEKHFLKDSESDEVWCVSVPNKTIMTRYRGRTLITGNCSPRFCGFYGGACKYT